MGVTTCRPIKNWDSIRRIHTRQSRSRMTTHGGRSVVRFLQALDVDRRTRQSDALLPCPIRRMDYGLQLDAYKTRTITEFDVYIPADLPQAYIESRLAVSHWRTSPIVLIHEPPAVASKTTLAQFACAPANLDWGDEPPDSGWSSSQNPGARETRTTRNDRGLRRPITCLAGSARGAPSVWFRPHSRPGQSASY